MMGVKRNLDAAGLSANASSITEDEAQLYDRQIRLWGMDCQKRLRAAKILVIGLNGLGAEVVKNLTLSGVKSITIVDDTKIKPSDFCAQFFIAGSESGKNRAEASKAAIQELNPNVEIIIDTEPISSKPTQFFAGFQAVFATDCPLNILIKVNKACRENSVLFYCGDAWGFYGYGFLDLLDFTYTSVVKKGKEPNEEVNKIGKLEFCPLGSALGAKVGAGLNRKVNNVFFLLHVMNVYRETNKNQYPLPESRETDIEALQKTRSTVSKALNLDEARLTDDMLRNVFGELSPVCAAVGGVLANEIVKGISRQGKPLCNFFLFDGDNCVGAVESVLVKS